LLFSADLFQLLSDQNNRWAWIHSHDQGQILEVREPLHGDFW